MLHAEDRLREKGADLNRASVLTIGVSAGHRHGCGVLNAAAQTDQYPEAGACRPIPDGKDRRDSTGVKCRSPIPYPATRPIRVLGRQGYETAVQADGFVSIVGRGWMAGCDLFQGKYVSPADFWPRAGFSSRTLRI